MAQSRRIVTMAVLALVVATAGGASAAPEAGTFSWTLAGIARHGRGKVVAAACRSAFAQGNYSSSFVRMAPPSIVVMFLIG